MTKTFDWTPTRVLDQEKLIQLASRSTKYTESLEVEMILDDPHRRPTVAAPPLAEGSRPIITDGMAEDAWRLESDRARPEPAAARDDASAGASAKAKATAPAKAAESSRDRASRAAMPALDRSSTAPRTAPRTDKPAYPVYHDDLYAVRLVAGLVLLAAIAAFVLLAA